MDTLVNQLPFFTPDHRNLAQSVAKFAELEIEPRAVDERDVEETARHYISALAKSGALNYVVSIDSRLDVRSICLIREGLAYSSALADLAFIMQGLGTYAISQGAPDHVREFWLSRAVEGKAIAAFALT